MRTQDKLKQIAKANILAEQRYLKSKGLIIEQQSDTYFETLSTALDAVRAYAESNGYTLDEDDIQFQFGTGGISYGQTKSSNINLLKNGQPILNKRGQEMNRAVHVSIYRMDSGTYELTVYKTF